MKKITLILTMLFIATLNWQGNAQTICTQNFTGSGQDDDPTVVTVNTADITCNSGETINSITLVNPADNLINNNCAADGSSWYNFTLNIDGTDVITGCGSDFDGYVVPTSFSTLTITSTDTDNWSDTVTITFDLEINHVTPSCVAPTALNTTNLTATSADLNWTAATGAVDYNWEVQPQGTAQGTAGATANGTGVAGTTVNTGNTLTADTSYDFFVQTNCGGSGTSTWAGPFTFYTGYCVSNPSSNDGNGISNVQISATNFANGDVTYFDHTGTVVDIAQNTLANLQITFETGYTYDTNVWIDFNDNLEFEASEQVFDGMSTSANPTTLDASFNVDAAATLGNHRMRIGTADTGQSTPDPCYNGTYGVTLDFMVNVTHPPACLTPTSLNTTYPTSTTANLAWTENNSPAATSWNVEWGVTGFTQGTGTVITGTTTNPQNITGLTARTDYDFYVQTDCGSSTSAWAGPFTWTQPDNGDECTLPIVATLEADCATATPTTLDFANAVTEVLTSCDGFGNLGYWLKVNSGTLGAVKITNTGTSIGLAIYESCGGTEVYCANNNLDVELSLSGLTPNTDYYYYFWKDSAVGTADICFEEVTCLFPTTLTTASITSTTTDTSWIDNNGGSSTYLVEWRVAGSAGAYSNFTTATGATSYQITGLDPATTYEWQVTADCGAGGSSAAATGTTFTTLCPTTFTPDYNQDFASFVPSCWDEATNGDLTSGPSGLGTGSWTNSSVLGSGSTRINLYNTSHSDWILSPNFDLSAGGYEVLIDVAVTNWNSAAADAMGSDDAIQLAYTEDGTTWTNITTWTVADNLPNTPTRFSFTLASTAANVQFGILATDGPTDDSQDYDFHVDNFKIRTIPPCPEPSFLTATNVTKTTADLSWTENGTTTFYDIEIDLTGFTPTGTPTITGVSNPYTKTGLTSSTTYDYYVRADCGGFGTSVWVGPYTFTTALANDTCIDTELLSVGTVFADQEIITTNVGSTASGELPTPSCSSFGTGEDVWYGVIVPASGHVIIETASDLGSAISDTGMSLYSGNCGSLTEIDCDDDGGIGLFSKIEYFGTPDEVLFVRVFEYGNNTFDTFKISAYDGLCTGGITTWSEDAGGVKSWDNGAPTNTMHAIIDAYYLTTTKGPINACSLEITSNGTLMIYDTFEAGKYVKVENGILNNGSINVLDTGNLVQVNNNTGVGGTYILSQTKVLTTALQDESRYTYIGSPVQNQNTNDVFSWGQDVWDFNESTQFWHYLGTGTSANTTMGAGVGYAVSPTTANTGGVQAMYFNGHFNNGVITRPLVLDVGTHESTVPDGDDDATLVANPYPSGLDLIGATGLIASNTINDVMIWTHDSALDPASTTGFAGDDYIVCNLGGCTNAPTGGTHAGIAAVGQGFFVNANTAGTLTFNNSMRTTTGNNEFRRPNNANDDKVWINLGNSLGYNSNILLNFTNNGTPNFDAKYDAKKPLSTTFGTSFYSLNTDNQKLAINDTGLINESTSIPVGFIANDPAITDLSISIANIENLTDTNIYVVDHVLNITHDLKISDYNFAINNTGENNTRFEIVFSRTPLSVDNNNIANTNLTVSNFNETQVKVNMLDGSIIKNLKAFDALGRLVIDMDANSSNFLLNKTFNQGQILIVKATLENGQVITTKFIKL